MIFRTGHRAPFLRPQDYSARSDYRPPAGWYRRLNAALGVPLTCLGLAPRDAVVLEVAGRTTGRTRRTPVLVTTMEAGQYLVALAGRSHWVRNVRAAGGQARLCRRGRRVVVLVEVPEQDLAQIAEHYPVFRVTEPDTASRHEPKAV